MKNIVKKPISVIIVNYNAGDLLTYSVRSVLASDTLVELVVVDNASVDGSIAVLREQYGADSRLRIVENAENGGFAKAANQEVEKTTGDYLLFLNPDCLIQPHTLTRFRKVLESERKAGMVGCLVRNPDGSEQNSCRRTMPDPWRALVQILRLHRLFPRWFQGISLNQQTLPKHPIEIEGISGACMFVRRKALKQVGLMDESYFLHCEDLDWFMRFHQQGWKILFVPDMEVMHVKGVCGRREPIRILWYKHNSMLKFYRKFYAARYPRLLGWLITVAVWGRFGLLASGAWLRSKLSRQAPV